MKILIVAFWFPPANVIGAVRVGKLARHLHNRGHEVHILAADTAEERSLPLELPAERVIYTKDQEGKDWLGRVVRWFRCRPAVAMRESVDDASVEDAPFGRSPWRALRRHYHALIHIPDMRASWINIAVPAGRQLLEKWRPEIIFASAPPYTGLIVASRLARSFGIPWVADLRDLWVDNPYYGEPAWRRPIDALLERLTLRSATRLVTVSPIWADQLRRKYDKPAEVIYNGYAEEDFPPISAQAVSGEVLTIRYMGSIYPKFRDPSAIFAAVALLPAALRRRVRVEFYSDAHGTVIAAAQEHGVLDAVVMRPRVPYRCALELQLQADVLLLLQSSNQRDEGNLPAKLFEYLFARRPILLIGYERGIAAHLVNERAAGLVSNDPLQIRDQLHAWIVDKQLGRLGRLDVSVSRGLSRDEQNRKLEQLFAEILREPTTPLVPRRRPRRGLHAHLPATVSGEPSSAARGRGNPRLPGMQYNNCLTLSYYHRGQRVRC